MKTVIGWISMDAMEILDRKKDPIPDLMAGGLMTEGSHD